MGKHMLTVISIFLHEAVQR